MGDVGETFKDMKEVSRKQRANNRDRSPAVLKQHGIKFESKNGGAHLIVKGRDCLIDFWPGTGKYITRKGKHGRGVFNLIKLCDQENTELHRQALATAKSDNRSPEEIKFLQDGLDSHLQQEQNKDG